MSFWLAIFLFSCSSVVVIGQNQPDQSRQTEIQLYAAPQYSEEVCSFAEMKANCHVFFYCLICWFPVSFRIYILFIVSCLPAAQSLSAGSAFPCPSLVLPCIPCVPASVLRASLVCDLFNFCISLLSCFLSIPPACFCFVASLSDFSFTSAY